MDDDLLRLLVVVAQQLVVETLIANRVSTLPEPGDLVVEMSKRAVDPDGIGFLVDHGPAAYREDGTGPKREVWDIMPLSGRIQENLGVTRWENAEFRRVPLPELSGGLLDVLKEVERVAV